MSQEGNPRQEFTVPAHVVEELGSHAGDVSPASGLVDNKKVQTESPERRNIHPRSRSFEATVDELYSNTYSAYQDMGVLEKDSLIIKNLSLPSLAEVQEVMHHHFSEVSKDFIVDQLKNSAQRIDHRPELLLTPFTKSAGLNDLIDGFNRLGPKSEHIDSIWNNYTADQLDDRSVQPELVAKLGDFAITVGIYDGRDLNEVIKGHPNPKQGGFGSVWFSDPCLDMDRWREELRSVQELASQPLAGNEEGIIICQQNVADFIVSVALRRLAFVQNTDRLPARNTIFTQLPSVRERQVINPPPKKKLLRKAIPQDPIEEQREFFATARDTALRDGSGRRHSAVDLSMDTEKGMFRSGKAYGLNLAVAK